MCSDRLRRFHDEINVWRERRDPIKMITLGSCVRDDTDYTHVAFVIVKINTANHFEEVQVPCVLLPQTTMLLTQVSFLGPLTLHRVEKDEQGAGLNFCLYQIKVGNLTDGATRLMLSTRRTHHS